MISFSDGIGESPSPIVPRYWWGALFLSHFYRKEQLWSQLFVVAPSSKVMAVLLLVLRSCSSSPQSMTRIARLSCAKHQTVPTTPLLYGHTTKSQASAEREITLRQSPRLLNALTKGNGNELVTHKDRHSQHHWRETMGWTTQQTRGRDSPLLVFISNTEQSNTHPKGNQCHRTST